MTASPTDSLVSTEWLARHLQAPDVRVVDASYYLPGEGLDPRAEFEALLGRGGFELKRLVTTRGPFHLLVCAPKDEVS